MIANKEALLGQPARTMVRVGRLERDKALHWLGLACALSVSAALNLWNLAQNGYGNTYGRAEHVAELA